jgi:hypothetical protein
MLWPRGPGNASAHFRNAGCSPAEVQARRLATFMQRHATFGYDGGLVHCFLGLIDCSALHRDQACENR